MNNSLLILCALCLFGGSFATAETNTALRPNIVFILCDDLGYGDVGVFYTGRDWTVRDNVIRHNHIHDVVGGGSGIVLDNASAGIVVEHNIVHHVACDGLLFNFNDLGNIVQNNIVAFAGRTLVNRAGDEGKMDQTGVFYRNPNPPPTYGDEVAKLQQEMKPKALPMEQLLSGWWQGQ